MSYLDTRPYVLEECDIEGVGGKLRIERRNATFTQSHAYVERCESHRVLVVTRCQLLDRVHDLLLHIIQDF